MFAKKFFALLVLMVTLALASGSAMAQNTKIFQFGETSVKLSSSFLHALQTLKVTPGVITPTQLSDTDVNFPIIGGAIDLDTALGNIEHSGGLTLTAGKTVLGIQNFIIDTTGKTPVITGLAVLNGAVVGRITLLWLRALRQRGHGQPGWGRCCNPEPSLQYGCVRGRLQHRNSEDRSLDFKGVIPRLN
jgi:hypothetical protein